MPVFGIERLLTMVPLGSALGVVGVHASFAIPALLPLAVAGAAAVHINQQKKTIARQNSFIAWTHSYAAAARSDDSHAFGDAMNTAGLELVQALDAGIKRRVAELAGARKHFEARVSETQTQRAIASKAAQERLARVEALNRRVQTILLAVQQQRVSDPPPVEQSPQPAAP
jgi:hypothetical protein